MPERVLIVEDERDVCRLLAFNLQNDGFEVASAHTAADGLLALARQQPTVVVLDLMLPDMSGLDVCRRIRRDPDLGDVGVVVLTALGADEDRIEGLEAGADDYVVKPFNVREVVLRVRALASRVGERRRASEASAGEVLRGGEVEVDASTHAVRVNGAAVALRPLEFKLLITLMAQPGRVFTREELLSTVWDMKSGSGARTVDVHVRRLRKNLGEGANVIETVPGFGYRARRSD